MPASYALVIYRGDSCRRQFRLWADAAKTVPVDLTGATAAAQIRATPGGPVIVAFACTIAANVIELVLTPAQSASLPHAARWDLQLTYANGDLQTIVAGTVTAGGEITVPALTAQGASA